MDYGRSWVYEVTRLFNKRNDVWVAVTTTRNSNSFHNSFLRIPLANHLYGLQQKTPPFCILGPVAPKIYLRQGFHLIIGKLELRLKLAKSRR